MFTNFFFKVAFLRGIFKVIEKKILILLIRVLKIKKNYAKIDADVVTQG